MCFIHWLHENSKGENCALRGSPCKNREKVEIVDKSPDPKFGLKEHYYWPDTLLQLLSEKIFSPIFYKGKKKFDFLRVAKTEISQIQKIVLANSIISKVTKRCESFYVSYGSVIKNRLQYLNKIY